MASLKLMSGHFLGGTEENGVILRIVGVQAEIRTEDISNKYS